MHTDACNNTIAAVLLQSDSDNPEDYHPVAYLSRKLSSAEKNYTIAEKETLAVIYALKNWRLYLFKRFEVLSDNKAVIFLSSKPRLLQREAHWVEFLTDFDYPIYHQHGHENVADPVSRLPDPQVNALEFVLDIHPDEAKEFQKVISKTENLRRSSKDWKIVWKIRCRIVISGIQKTSVCT